MLDASRAKRWLLRLAVRGRRRDMGLGGLLLVSLAEARDLAIQYRKIARSSEDPVQERQIEIRVAPAFADAAKPFTRNTSRRGKTKKQAQQWITTLEANAFPIIGRKRVDHIETSDIFNVRGSGPNNLHLFILE